jgi:hypothetical protein
LGSYLKDRIQKVDINGKLSTEQIFNISVKEGSILGPILFLIILMTYSASSLATIKYADDTICLASNENTENLFEYVNAELSKIAWWFRANKMAVNVGKTEFILFCIKAHKSTTNPLVSSTTTMNQTRMIPTSLLNLNVSITTISN